MCCLERTRQKLMSSQYSFKKETHARFFQCTIFNDKGSPLSWKNVLLLWQTQPSFAQQFGEFLVSCSSSFCFETVPFSSDTQDVPFEFVVIPSTKLNPMGERKHFLSYFKDSTTRTIAFSNVGKDATLVVPVPGLETKKDDGYAHLGAFLKKGSVEQIVDFWKCAAQTIQKVCQENGKKKVWVNTSGFGIPWLHLRIDSSPKYYQCSYKDKQWNQKSGNDKQKKKRKQNLLSFILWVWIYLVFFFELAFCLSFFFQYKRNIPPVVALFCFLCFFPRMALYKQKKKKCPTLLVWFLSTQEVVEWWKRTLCKKRKGENFWQHFEKMEK